MDLRALCDLMDNLSRETWKGLTESVGLGIPWGEVTITDTLLRALARHARDHASEYTLEVRPVTQTKEGHIGADFEFWLAMPDGTYRAFSLQAKKAKPPLNPGYDVAYLTGGRKQYEVLLEHATIEPVVPLHLFYNGGYCAHAPFPDPPREAMLYGCAIVPTMVVKSIDEEEGYKGAGRKSVMRYAPSSMPWSSIFRWPRDYQSWYGAGPAPAIPGLGEPFSTNGTWEQWDNGLGLLDDGVPRIERLPPYVQESLGGLENDDPTLPAAVVVISDPQG